FILPKLFRNCRTLQTSGAQDFVHTDGFQIQIIILWLLKTTTPIWAFNGQEDSSAINKLIHGRDVVSGEEHQPWNGLCRLRFLHADEVIQTLPLSQLLMELIHLTLKLIMHLLNNAQELLFHLFLGRRQKLLERIFLITDDEDAHAGIL